MRILPVNLTGAVPRLFLFERSYRRVKNRRRLPYATAATRRERIQLFRSLFRGREDVFARRWKSLKTGKAGYSPACANEWDPLLCAKATRTETGRNVNCADCCHHAFVPVTEQEIERHLTGHQVMGTYPLLADEACWFLAVDFDGGTWQEDVAAFRETCAAKGVTVAIERSRSGNGADAWLFFSRD